MKKTSAALIALFFGLLPITALANIHRHEIVSVDCLINAGRCSKKIPGTTIAVTFDITPKPVKFMADLVFSVAITEAGKSVTDAKVSLDLSMPGMEMGANQPKLTHTANGVYIGKGGIVRCRSGRKLWKALVEIKRGARKDVTTFTFEGK